MTRVDVGGQYGTIGTHTRRQPPRHRPQPAADFETPPTFSNAARVELTDRAWIEDLRERAQARGRLRRRIVEHIHPSLPRSMTRHAGESSERRGLSALPIDSHREILWPASIDGQADGRETRDERGIRRHLCHVAR